MNDVTLKQAQQQADEWIQTVGGKYFSELGCLAVMTEELGEVARVISRQYGEQNTKQSDEGLDLGDELADVLFAMVCLANKTGVDLTAAYARNMAKKYSRDVGRYDQHEEAS